VLTHVIAQERLPIALFTLNTGMLHKETLALIPAIKARYAIDVVEFAPVAASVDSYIKELGKFAFYDSLDARKRCCNIRKVEPLQRALKGRSAWLTGQRKEQSATRTTLDIEHFDEANGLVKFNPLANWSEAEVWAFIKANDIPYNALHDRGYPSIGCDPCTRAIRPGEDPRAGRWWWESRDNKECGLHVVSITKPQSQQTTSAEVVEN
jgi:phosphoadenosine phosphosulfate reductase